MPGKCLRDMALGQLDGCEMGLTVESEEREVPHLRWSQAPPLPWPRPGSADFYYVVITYYSINYNSNIGMSNIYQALYGTCKDCLF